jgi:hypothetical protein
MPNETHAEMRARRFRTFAWQRAGSRLTIPVVVALAVLLGTTGQVWASTWTGTLTLSPSEGTSGIQVTATASGAPPGDTVVIGYTTGNCSSNVTTISGATGTVNGSGGISVTFTIPAGLTPGNYTICVTDQQTQQPAPAQFTVLPTPSLSVSSPAIAGQPITVTGKNWLPTSSANGGSVEVLYGGTNGCASSAGTAPVDANGNFTITFNAPFGTGTTSLVITAVEPQGTCGQTNPPPTLQAQVTASVTVPSITVPQSVASGAQVTITGTNFAPNGGTVEFRYGPQGSNGCATAAGTATVGSDGTFSGTFTAPNETKDTTITVVALQPQGACGQSKLAATASLLVKAKSVTPPPPGNPILPYCVVALLLLLLLLLLLFLLFRRRKKDEPVTIEERDRVLVSPGPSARAFGGAVSTGSPSGAALIDRQIVARDRRGNEVVIAEEVTTVEEEEEEY